MKRINFLIVVCVVCFFVLSGKKTSGTYQSDIVPEKVAKQYTTNFYEFQNEVNVLAVLADNAVSENNLALLKEQVKKTRLAYKKIEFIFDYYQTSYNGTYINGAPLPKVSEYFEAGHVIEPGGLQALDEVVFEENSNKNFQHIKDLALGLKEHVDFVSQIHLPVHLKSSQIIECMRSGMVRIFTLGVTGFDTPGSGNALQESYVSLKSMESAFLEFEEGLDPAAKAEFKVLKKLFKKAKRQLKQTIDFNDFDRMVFLKEVVNPIYGGLLEFQISDKMKLEPFKSHAQNYQAKNIFDTNFLKTEFYQEFVYLPLQNPKTIELGQLLFEDSQLSNDNKMSCVTCHDPNKGFGDGLAKSFTNKPGIFTARNSPSILNAGYSTRYFWDMRAYNLEKQVTHVIDNDLEFSTSFDVIVNKLNRDSKYKILFKEAYGGISKKDINQRSISNAIAAYVNSLKSFNSSFDKYVRNQTDDYPQNAKRGFNLFMGKGACGSCHFAPMFNGTIPPFYLESESEVLGVTQGFDSINPIKDTDLGRMDNGLFVDKHPHFENSFKTVSVRNIALTAPYMHNGLFNTLGEVLEFYNRGGGAGMGLDIENQTLSDAPLNLTKQEMADIITFMETLTDTSGLLTYKD